MIMNKYLGVIVCHGDLAQGLISASTATFGKTDLLISFTNTNKAIPDLIEDIKKTLLSYPNLQPLFMVDVKGGSCWRAAKMIIKELNTGYLISGVNLTIVVNFLSKYEEIINEEFIQSLLIERAKLAIMGEK
jgi:mannose/fructose-specific phosphotransferase system component IIA